MLNLPNLLTLSNLFLGCCALLCVLRGEHNLAAWCTLGSFLCDYADGMVARALKISGPLGKELDSLADVISFGAVPGMMLYNILAKHSVTDYADRFIIVPTALPAFVLSAFAGLRLAKFNLDTRQTDYFLGLSTPACTIFVLGLSLSDHYNHCQMGHFLGQNLWLIYLLIPILCCLLVSEIPMYGLKIKSSNPNSYIPHLAFITLLFLMAGWVKSLALTIIIVLYIVASLLNRERITATNPS
jgi:CDP-diacylglycerol---serine O-phosphatidyltransferase